MKLKGSKQLVVELKLGVSLEIQLFQEHWEIFNINFFLTQEPIQKSLDNSSVERFRTELRFRIDLEHTDQPVSCIPDVSIVERDNEHDEFLVLGCDGVFDVLMNNELAILIKSLFAEKEDLSVTTEGKDIH